MIGICGLGYSGSGALNDLLKEFDGVKVYDDIEFDFVYAPDGIEDLCYHLCENPVRYLSGNTAIKRFINLTRDFSRSTSDYMKYTDGQFAEITKKYINSILQASWNGCDTYEKINSGSVRKTLKYRIGGRIDSCTQSILGAKGTHFSYSAMYLSVRPENFVEYSKQYLLDIMEAMGITEIDRKMDRIVLNQPFPSNAPQRYYKYFENPVAIVVDKDPRDQYILAKKVLRINGSFIPTEDVSDYILYYKKMHEAEEDVFKINFEDLIYKYEETIKMLSLAFNIGLHVQPYRYFNPKTSVNNTQLFKRYTEFEKDIRIIEEELSDYLYPFDDFDEIRFTGKPF